MPRYMHATTKVNLCDAVCDCLCHFLLLLSFFFLFLGECILCLQCLHLKY